MLGFWANYIATSSRRFGKFLQILGGALGFIPFKFKNKSRLGITRPKERYIYMAKSKWVTVVFSRHPEITWS